MVNHKRNSGRSTQTWLQGAVLLGVSAALVKLLGVLQKIPLQNIGGDEVYGIYNIVYPVYTLVMVLATAGFPLAVSRFVTEAESSGRYEESRTILKASMVLLLIGSLLAFVALYSGADWLAAAMGSASAAPSLRTMAFTLLFLPLAAGWRGYYQGRRDMLPTAVSQVGEQLVRVAVMLWAVILLTNAGAAAEQVTSGAMWGSVAGGAVSLLLVLWYDRRDRRSAAADADVAVQWRMVMLWMGRITRYGIPVCLGMIVVPILGIVDSFTLPHMLRGAEGSESAALRDVGIYSRALPLVQMVTMLFSSMAAALVPAIVEAKVSGRLGLARQRAVFSVRLGLWTGLGGTLGLALCAEPINRMLYMSGEGHWTFVILSGTLLFSVMQIVTASVLQGWGHALAPAIILLGAAAIKAGGNVLLVPILGMSGAAWSGVLAYGAACILNVMVFRRITKLPWPRPLTLLRPIAAALLMAVWLVGLLALAESLPDALQAERSFQTGLALLCVCSGAVVYLIGLLWVKALKKEEYREIPGIGRKLDQWLKT